MNANNTEKPILKSKTSWNEEGYRIKNGENPIKIVRGQYRKYGVYDISQVEKIVFNKSKRLIAQAAAQKAIQTKKKKTLAIVEQFKPIIQKIPIDELLEKAVEHYNSFHFENQDFDRQASVSDNIEFLHRITRNYLRHKLTSYDKKCNSLYKQIGRDEAYFLLRQKVEDAIDEVYPEIMCRNCNY